MSETAHDCHLTVSSDGTFCLPNQFAFFRELDTQPINKEERIRKNLDYVCVVGGGEGEWEGVMKRARKMGNTEKISRKIKER